MTDEPIAAPAAEPVVAPPPAPAAQPNGADPTPAYSVPEAYKDRGWAKNIKSEDDAWKMLDNAQTLAGKKTVAPDWEKATPKEIEDYYAQVRPSDKSAYQFDESVDPERKTAYADMLHKHGISAKQGNDLIKDYMAMEQKAVAEMYDKDEFTKELKESFGNDYEGAAGAVARTLAANLNEKDRATLEKVPNHFLGLIYRVVGKLNKTYGVTESGAPASVPGSVSTVNVEEAATKIRNDIQALSNRPHTAEEKQILVNQLAALYKGK